MTEDLTLLGWIQHHTDFASLEELSVATGVDLRTLRRIDAAEVLPTAPHTKALRTLFPGLPVELLQRHAHPEPVYSSTPAGALPAGTEFHAGTASDLRVGDLIPYTPPKGGAPRSGAHWIEVERVEEEGTLTLAIIFGGTRLACDKKMSIRFARRLSAD